MRIEHVAIWVHDLEKMRSFYCHYFGMTSGEKYENTKKAFSSYFLNFQDGASIEIMHQPGLEEAGKGKKPVTGIAHLAISAGSKEAVDRLTELLRNDGFSIAGEPRMTGDGYYESVILDPEGNSIEITA